MIPYREFYNYDRLERVAGEKGLLEDEVGEVALLNLYNHLIWHSYRYGADPVADAIFYAIVCEIMAENDADILDVPQEFQCVLSERR